MADPAPQTAEEVVQIPPKYVSPDGKRENDGSENAPWDIDSTFRGLVTIAPGTTIYMAGGTYRNPDRSRNAKFKMNLKGTAEAPIHIRPMPGERVTIDGGIEVLGSTQFVWVWDLEIIVAENLTAVRKTTEAGSHPKTFDWPWGSLNIMGGEGNKFINLVIHDNAQGVGFWKSARDSELHGCIIYDNGWIGPRRYHGPGIYTQNEATPRFITDNILFGNYSTTIQAYGSKNAYVNSFRVTGNIAYGPVKEGHRAKLLVGGGRPSEDIVVNENICYEVPIQVGYNAPRNKDCIVKDNIVVNAGLSINKYDEVVKEGNLILAPDAPRPDEPARVILRPNKYDANRANLAIFNWKKAKTVAADVSAFLKPGDAYRLMDPADFFGKPVLEGALEGGTITVPLTGEFACFVLLRTKPAE